MDGAPFICKTPLDNLYLNAGESIVEQIALSEWSAPEGKANPLKKPGKYKLRANIDYAHLARMRKEYRAYADH